jgi:hypothetical protein
LRAASGFGAGGGAAGDRRGSGGGHRGKAGATAFRRQDHDVSGSNRSRNMTVVDSNSLEREAVEKCLHVSSSPLSPRSFLLQKQKKYETFRETKGTNKKA